MRFLFAFILIGFFLQGMPQGNITFDKDNFPDDQKDRFKEAVKNLKEGDDFFFKKEIPMYTQALEYYLKANDFNPNNAVLNYQIGICYIKGVQKVKALPYLEKAQKLDPGVDPMLLYYLGHAYHLNLELDKAIETYRAYRNTLSPQELAKRGADVDKRIQECETAMEIIKNPIPVFIDNMGRVINSSFPEYSPFINADETVIMFTSSRDNTTGGDVDPFDLLYFEDIYISYKENDIWQLPSNPGKPLNTDSHDAIVGVSPDGKHALIYKGDENGGDIYECRIKDGFWQNPQRLPKEINTDYHETSASFTPDMSAIYFVSDKPGGYGGSDIYVSKVIVKEKSDKLDFEDAVNLGPAINTPYDEEGVFAHPDGKTLYFSSKGHRTMGGYDIFKSVNENGNWSTPENIGYPVNTPDNDVFFSISEDNHHGYYSSFDLNGFGLLDLFMITFLGPEKTPVFQNDYDILAYLIQPLNETILEKKVEVKEAAIAIVRGTIYDAITLEPVGGAMIDIFDNEINRIVANFESRTSTGEYMVSLPSGRNYGFSVKAPEYLFHSENLNIPRSVNVREIYMDIYLKKVEVGSKIILKNIFFDFDKATLRPESFAELNRLVKLLNDVPTMTIEISGHTDNVGSEQYNQKLSEARAGAVVDYLIEQGIDPGRLTFAGYGFSQPIATNDTDEGRQLNRRTEFKVLSK